MRGEGGGRVGGLPCPKSNRTNCDPIVTAEHWEHMVHVKMKCLGNAFLRDLEFLLFHFKDKVQKKENKYIGRYRIILINFYLRRQTNT